MANVTSLGLSKPAALQLLIEEGWLPKDPRPEDYCWQVQTFNDGHGDVQEELLSTSRCVVWSHGKLIKCVYRLDLELEHEHVQQAILTQFPYTSPTQKDVRCAHQLRAGQKNANPLEASKPSARPSTSNRCATKALVILLKTKAYIYFSQGGRQIVPLPFEIYKAFPAPRGLVLQRKLANLPSPPPTPRMPFVPNNSSFSSFQNQPTSSFLSSPSLQKSFAGVRPQMKEESSQLGSLFDDILEQTKRRDVELHAALYTLTSPLSNFGEIVYSIHHPTRSHSNPDVEFEPLDEAEQVVYVSPESEFRSTSGPPQCALMMIITYNRHLFTLTVWHSWYVIEKSLASLFKQRAEQKAAKARRRSSFLTMTIAGTGTTTPAVRERDGARESFAGEPHLRAPGKRGKSQRRQSSRKLTQQEEEDAFVHQLDPDYQPVSSQPPGREPSRRISSMVSRSEADPRASQAPTAVGPGGRRHTSFGLNDRRSFGHSRRSRGSTPGSVYSRSFLGMDDDSMDLDTTFDEIEDVESIVKQIQATFTVAGTDTVFGGTGQGTKHELVVRKVHAFQLSHSHLPQAEEESDIDRFKIVTLCNEDDLRSADDCYRLGIWVHDRQSRSLQCLNLEVHRRELWRGHGHGQKQASEIDVPIVIGIRQAGQCDDITKIEDHGTEAVLLGGQGIVFNATDHVACPLPRAAPYRVFESLEMATSLHAGSKDYGKNRTLQAPSHPVQLKNHGPNGAFDEIGVDRTYHRRKLQLSPRDDRTRDLLKVCSLILPQTQAQMLPRIWCMAHSALVERWPSFKFKTSLPKEFVAFAAAVFTFAISVLDKKARAALNISSLSSSPRGVVRGTINHTKKERYESRTLKKRVWDWCNGQGHAPEARSASPSDQLLPLAAALADEIATSVRPWGETPRRTPSAECVSKLMVGLHVYREAQKLNMANSSSRGTGAIVAQLGAWLGLQEWSYINGKYYSFEGAASKDWTYVKSTPSSAIQAPIMQSPTGLFQWWEQTLREGSSHPYSVLSSLADPDIAAHKTQALTPRICAINEILQETDSFCSDAPTIVQSMVKHHISSGVLETFPAAIAAPFQQAIAHCERRPPTVWSSDLLHLVGRDDLETGAVTRTRSSNATTAGTSQSLAHDVQSVCYSLDQHTQVTKTKEASRHAVSRLIFCEDRRLVEAINLMHFNSIQVAECAKQPDWSDAVHLEQQRRVTQWVMLRMIALPAGDGMLHFDSQTPLLTEKFVLPGFNANCVMYPMGHTITTDRSGLTEERVNWAYFHAGVSAGLRISRNLKGIDTSWVVFNRPNELTNRHAGLLLALGLNGHLRNIAKWLSFKYLTPKHTMTSVALLLGLSASYMGSMDSLVTRMLSVHITRMLPPGAAELNVSPLTQTAGLMGIGLLYLNTQHRRMSETMLSEIEFMEIEDPDDAPDILRDESYRLAAGFALGYINLGSGGISRGLHGLQLPERLLYAAVGPRPISAVHVFDKTTAGAVIALALIYMKTGDAVIARKVDVPDTEAQFDQVRPDMLLLRTMTRHLIMWDDIDIHMRYEHDRSVGWITQHLPSFYRSKSQELKCSTKSALQSHNVAFFNVCTGLAWVLSLRYAGSGNKVVRDEILELLTDFYAFMGRGDAYYYDGKIARASLRRCIDVLAISAALVMAGTGDLEVFRRLRRLHGRTDADTPYGSHFAAHFAIGILFLGGGTYTFGTSNIAIASLVCATYPLFPTEVQDNRVHLQAFRHFWVFAIEPRCIVIEDVDTGRPIHMNIAVEKKDGSTDVMRAPCLLPEIHEITCLRTIDSNYWQVTLDFANNPLHLESFRRSQHLFVRRCPATEAHKTIFSATLGALNESQISFAMNTAIWSWFSDLPAFKELDRADFELILPPDTNSSIYMNVNGSVVDDRLALRTAALASNERDALWNLRCLFAWGEKMKSNTTSAADGKFRWLGSIIIEGMKAAIEERMRMANPPL